MLARNTTYTLSRDADLGFTFIGVNYYDGQGFMVPKALGVTSAKELDGASVCIQTGTTTELNLADFRSEEHTSELQSLMRISYAVFCLQKKQTPLRHSRH